MVFLKRIIVLRTSTDDIMCRLFEEIKDNEIFCMIASSQIDRYREMYPNIKFIDIQRERFYDLPPEVLSNVNRMTFNELYVTLPDIVGYYYENVMAVVDRINWRKAFFYNCNGDRVEIPGKMRSFIYRVYIRICELIYR